MLSRWRCTVWDSTGCSGRGCFRPTPLPPSCRPALRSANARQRSPLMAMGWVGSGDPVDPVVGFRRISQAEAWSRLRRRLRPRALGARTHSDPDRLTQTVRVHAGPAEDTPRDDQCAYRCTKRTLVDDVVALQRGVPALRCIRATTLDAANAAATMEQKLRPCPGPVSAGPGAGSSTSSA